MRFNPSEQTGDRKRDEREREIEEERCVTTSASRMHESECGMKAERSTQARRNPMHFSDRYQQREVTFHAGNRIYSGHVRVRMSVRVTQPLHHERLSDASV